MISPEITKNLPPLEHPFTADDILDNPACLYRLKYQKELPMRKARPPSRLPHHMRMLLVALLVFALL